VFSSPGFHLPALAGEATPYKHNAMVYANKMHLQVKINLAIINLTQTHEQMKRPNLSNSKVA
jgi:hypothetical protein